MTSSPQTSGRPAPTGSVLALDVGDVRIGVAVSESGIIATPLDAIMRGRIGKRATLDAVEALVGQYRVGTVVVGLPRLESGAEGAQAEATRAWVRSLQRRIPAITVAFWDERHTSAEAAEFLRGRPMPPGRLDSIAAAIILREYLDAKAGPGG